MDRTAYLNDLSEIQLLAEAKRLVAENDRLLASMAEEPNPNLKQPTPLVATLLDIARSGAYTERRPYAEWCRKPEACAGKGYCPLDPTCGD